MTWALSATSLLPYSAQSCSLRPVRPSLDLCQELQRNRLVRRKECLKGVSFLDFETPSGAGLDLLGHFGVRTAYIAKHLEEGRASVYQALEPADMVR